MGTEGIPSFPGKSGNVAGSPCGSSPPEPCPLPEVRSGTAAWSSNSTLLRAFSCRSCMSKSRWVASILEMLSFFLKWRFPDSGVALMGVLVSGRLASGGSPSSARLTVWYVLWEQGPFGTDRRDSVWKAVAGRIP